MGNQPESMIDPNGLKYEVFMEAVLTAPDLPIESTDALDRAGHMSRMKIEELEEISDFFNTSLLLVSIGDTENLINSYYSEQQQEAITSSIVESVTMSFAPTGTSAVMRSDVGVEGDGLINQSNEGGDNDRPFGTSYEQAQGRKLPVGQDPWVSDNRLKNSDGQRVYTLAEFVEYNEGLSYEEIINQRPKSSGQPGGPQMRYVINPKDGNLMDMRHVLVVGYGKGMIVGHAVEFFQLFTPKTFPSAMNPQDFYSNRIGADFHWFSITPHARSIKGFANKFNDFMLYHAKKYYSSAP